MGLLSLVAKSLCIFAISYIAKTEAFTFSEISLRGTKEEAPEISGANLLTIA